MGKLTGTQCECLYWASLDQARLFNGPDGQYATAGEGIDEFKVPHQTLRSLKSRGYVEVVTQERDRWGPLRLLRITDAGRAALKEAVG